MYQPGALSLRIDAFTNQWNLLEQKTIVEVLNYDEELAKAHNFVTASLLRFFDTDFRKFLAVVTIDKETLARVVWSDHAIKYTQDWLDQKIQDAASREIVEAMVETELRIRKIEMEQEIEREISLANIDN
jgi:hypothetical protein